MTKQPYTTRRGETQFRPVMSETEYRQQHRESLGFCLACGTIADETVEPDARRYPCERCEQNKVYGLEELFLMGLLVLSDQSTHP